MARQSTVFDKNNAQPITCNLLHFEMSKRVPANVEKVIKQPHTKKYFELIEKTTDSGIVEELVEREYPITPDYVKSFEASANYKNDVNNAMANGVSGTNIGDGVSIQQLQNMDISAIRDLQSKLNQIAQMKGANVENGEVKEDAQ